MAGNGQISIASACGMSSFQMFTVTACWPDAQSCDFSATVDRSRSLPASLRISFGVRLSQSSNARLAALEAAAFVAHLSSAKVFSNALAGVIALSAIGCIDFGRGDCAGVG